MYEHEGAGCICAVMCLCFLVLGVLLGNHITSQEFKKQAIEHKAAHWTLNEDGTVEFEWNSIGQQ